jgi:hypothetical protein
MLLLLLTKTTKAASVFSRILGLLFPILKAVLSFSSSSLTFF